MKKSIPKRILSVFLALLMFFTTFPVGAIQAFANVASGQITISNGKKYKVAWNYNYGKNENGKIRIPEYSREIAGNKAGAGTTNLLRKYVSSDLSGSEKNAGKDEVPIFRLSRSYGYTSDESGASAVTTINVDPNKITDFINAAKSDGIKLPEKRARRIYYVLLNGFKQFTTNSGDQFYREQLYFIATQCILWELDEGKRVGFGNDTKWTDVRSKSYKANAKNKERSQDIVGSYSKSIDASYRYYWHDFYYTVKNKYFNNVKDCPDYYNEILEAAEMQMNGQKFQYKNGNQWRNFSDLGSNDYTQMAWNDSKKRYESTYYVSKKFLGTEYGKYDPNKIVLPIRNSDGSVFTTTFTSDVKVYSQATTQSKVICNVDSAMRNKMVTSKGKRGPQYRGTSVLGKTRNGKFYCVYFGDEEKNTTSYYGYVPVSSAKLKTKPAEPVMKVEVSGNKLTFYTSRRSNVSVNLAWHMNAPDIYNKATYFQGKDKTAGVKGYICGGRYNTVRVLFNLKTVAHKAYLKCSEDGATLKTIAVAHGETVSGSYFNDQEKTHPQKHNNYKYTYSYKHWSASKNGSKMTNPAPSQKKIYGETTFWMCLDKKENAKGRAVYYCGLCGAQLYDTSTSKIEKEHYAGEKYTIPTGSKHVCSVNDRKITYNGKTIDVGDYLITFQGWGQDSNANAKLATGTLNDSLSVLNNHKAGSQATVPSSTQKYYAKYTLKLTNENKVLFKCSIDENEIALLRGAPGSTQGPVPAGESHNDSSNLSNLQYKGHPLSDYKITFSYWGTNPDYTVNDKSDDASLTVGNDIAMPSAKVTVYYAKYTFTLQSTVNFVCALCGETISSTTANVGQTINAPSVNGHNCTGTAAIAGLNGDLEDLNRTFKGWGATADNYDYAKDQVTTIKTPAEGEVTYYAQWQLQNNISAAGSLSGIEDLLNDISNYESNYKDVTIDPSDDQAVAAAADAKEAADAAQKKISKWVSVSDNWTLQEGSNKAIKPSGQAGVSTDYENSVETDMYVTDNNSLGKVVTVSIPKSTGFKIVSIVVDDGAVNKDGSPVGSRTLYPQNSEQFYKMSFNTNVASLKASDIHVTFAPVSDSKVILNYVALTDSFDYNSSSIYEDNAIVSSKVLDWDAAKAFTFKGGYYEDTVEQTDADGNTTTTTENVPYFKESVEYGGSTCDYVGAYGYIDVFGNYQHKEVAGEPDFTVDEMHGTLNVYLYYMPKGDGKGGIEYNLFARGDEAVEALNLLKTGSQLLLYRSKSLSSLPVNADELFDNINEKCGSKFSDYLTAQNNYAWKCSCGSIVENASICPDCGKSIDDQGSVPEFWVVPEAWQCSKCETTNSGLECDGETCTNTYMQQTASSKTWKCSTCGHSNSTLTCQGSTYDVELVKDITANVSESRANVNAFKEYPYACEGHGGDSPYTGGSVSLIRCSKCHKWFSGGLGVSNGRHTSTAYVGSPHIGYSKISLALCGGGGTADQSDTAYVRTGGSLISSTIATGWQCSVCGTKHPAGRAYCGHSIYPNYVTVSLPANSLTSGYYYYFVIKDNKSDRYYYNDEVTGGSVRYTNNHLVYNAEAYYGDQLNQIKVYDNSTFNSRTPVAGARVMVLSESKYKELVGLKSADDLTWTCYGCSYKECPSCKEKNAYDAIVCANCGAWLSDIPTYKTNPYNTDFCSECNEPRSDPDFQILKTDENGAVMFYGDADTYKFFIMPEDFTVSDVTKNIKDYNEVHLNYYTYEEAFKTTPKAFETVSEKSVVSSLEKFKNANTAGQKSIVGKTYLTEVELCAKERIDLRLHTLDKSANLNPGYKQGDPVENVSMNVYKMDSLGVYQSIERDKVLNTSKDFDFYSDDGTYLNYSYYPAEPGTYKFEFFFVDKNGEKQKVWTTRSGSVSFKENVQEIKYTGKYAKLDYYLKKQTYADDKTVTTFFDSVDRSYNESGVSFYDNDNIVYSLYTKNEKDELVPYTTLDLNKIGILAELSQKVNTLNAQKETDAKNFSKNSHPSFNKSYTYHDDATNDNFTITVDYQDYEFFASKAMEFANRWGECHNPYSPITEKNVTNAADALAAISNITPIKKYYISITTKSPEDLYYSVSCDGFTSDESSTVFKVDSKSLANYEYSADTEGTIDGYNALSDFTVLNFANGNDVLLNIGKGDQTQSSQLNGIITTSNGLPIIGYDGVEYSKLFDQFILRGNGNSTIALKDHINEDQINSLQSVLENDMMAYGVMLEYYPTGKPVAADAERAWDADGMDSTQNKYSVIKSQYNKSKTGVIYKGSVFDYANKSVLYFGDSAEGATPGALYNMLCGFAVRHQAADRDGYVVLKVLCSEATIDIYATDLATKYSIKNSLQSTNPVVANPFIKSSNLFIDGVPSEFVGISAVEFKEDKLKTKVTNIDNLATAQVTNREDAQNATARVTLDNTLQYLNLYTSKIATPLAVLKDYNVSPDGNATVINEDNDLLTDADGYIYTLNANCSLDATTKDVGKSNFIYVGYKFEDNDGSNPAYPKNTHPYKMSVRLLSSVDKTLENDDRRLFGLFGTSTRVTPNGTTANNIFTFKSDVQGSKPLGYETVEHYTAEMDLKTYQIKTSIQNGTITKTVTGLRAGNYKNIAGADSVVTFTPDPGYQITSVKIDGKELNSGEKLTGAQLVWTGDNKSGKISISGTLSANHTVDVVCTRTYTITTSITNGTITDTITKIKYGETKTIEFTPNDGFMVNKIVIDKGLDTEKTISDVYKYWSGGSYTFENITADHSFDVECTAGIVVNTYLSKEAYEAAGGFTDPIDPLKRQVDLLPYAIPDSAVKEKNVSSDTMTELEFAKMLYGPETNRDTIDENSWAAQFGEVFALSPEEQIENMGFAVSSGVQANTKLSSYYNKEDFPFVFSYYFPKELLDSLTAYYLEPSTMWFGCGPSGTANLKYQLCYEVPGHKDSDKKHISLFGGVPTDGSKGATYNVGCYVNEKYLPVDVKFQYPNAKYSYGTDVVTSFIVDNHSTKNFTDQNALNATGGLYAKLYNLNTGEWQYEAIENVEVKYDKKLIGRYNCQYAARTAVVPAEKNNLIYYTVRTPAVSSIDRSYGNLGYKFYGIIPWVQLRYNDEENGQFVYCDSGLQDKNLVQLNDLDDTSFTNYEGYNLNGGDGYSYKDPTNDKPYANTTSWQEYTCENGVFKLHTYTARLGFQENLLKPLASTGAGSAQNPSKKVENNNDENYWETKSGYSLESRVTANLTPQRKKDPVLPNGSCVNAQSALAYYPEYNYQTINGKYSALYAMYGFKSAPTDRKYFGPYASLRPTGANTNENPYWFKFMEYEDEDCNARSLHHVPVWYPNDTDYKIQVRVADCWTPSGMLSYVGDSNAVKINGSLFDDFKTRETSPW